MAIEERDLPAIQDNAIALTFTMSVQEAVRRIKELQAFVASVMVKGEDYGVIPGTPKPTLLKPGAEKLCEIYGLAPQFDIVNRIEDWTNGFFQYEVKCTLVHKKYSIVVAEGLGSCNTKEARYRWRWVPENEVPPGVDKSTLLKKSGSKWVFKSEIPDGLDISKLPTEERISKKTGNPYTVYNVGQDLYRIENDDPYTLVNTVLKMAKKRALVDAALSATRSSGIFTQDVEDFQDENEVFNNETEAVKENRNAKNKYQKHSETKFEAKTEAKSNGLNWSAFWAKAKGPASKGGLSLKEEDIYGAASAYFMQEVKSLTDVIKTQEALDQFLHYLQSLGADPQPANAPF